jgi:hypothetical protein
MDRGEDAPKFAIGSFFLVLGLAALGRRSGFEDHRIGPDFRRIPKAHLEAPGLVS